MINHIRLQLHSAIYRTDSFVLMLRYCANLKAIRYESTSFNRIIADKLHHVIVALDDNILLPTNANPWTNYENGNEYLIIGAVVRSKYSNIRYQHLIIGNVQNFVWSHKNDFQE